MSIKQATLILASISAMFIILASTIGVLGYSMHKQQINDQNARLQLISAVCDWSRNGDTSSERSMCGVVENATNTEFLCSNDFNCWAEQK